jgi:hypothetical protein
MSFTTDCKGEETLTTIKCSALDIAYSVSVTFDRYQWCVTSTYLSRRVYVLRPVVLRGRRGEILGKGTLPNH